jgi:glycogen operon protein
MSVERLARPHLPARRDLGRRGTNFSIFTEHAERVELCLFNGDEAEQRVELTERTAHTWHCYLPGDRPGPALRLPRARALRPAAGHRFNPAKLLLDPYAKSIDGPVRWDAANVLPYKVRRREDADLGPTTRTASAPSRSRW